VGELPYNAGHSALMRVGPIQLNKKKELEDRDPAKDFPPTK